MSLIRFGDLSESVDAKLGDRLFHLRYLMVVSGVLQVTSAAIAYLRTGHSWCIWWGIAAFVLVLARVGVDEAFARRRVITGRPTVWRRRFSVGLLASGLLYGLAGAAAVLNADPLTQLMVITVLTGFVMGTGSRNSAYPQAAIGAILLATAPLALSCLVTRDVFYLTYSAYVVLFTVMTVSMARFLYVQAVQTLLTDEKRASLMDEVGRSNRDLADANSKLAAVNADLASVNGQFAVTNAELETVNAKLNGANAKLASMNAKLAMAPVLDMLTGLPNRKKFADSLDIETRSARRDGSSLSVLKFNIDWFKRYNDVYGHGAGDECLRLIAQALKSGLHRPRDLVARPASDDFLALLPFTDSAKALIVATKLLRTIEKLALPHKGSPEMIVTLSIGLTSSIARGKPNAEDMLKRVDVALEAAKRAGRNTLHVEYPPDVATIPA